MGFCRLGESIAAREVFKKKWFVLSARLRPPETIEVSSCRWVDCIANVFDVISEGHWRPPRYSPRAYFSFVTKLVHSMHRRWKFRRPSPNKSAWLHRSLNTNRLSSHRKFQSEARWISDQQLIRFGLGPPLWPYQGIYLDKLGTHWCVAEVGLVAGGWGHSPGT